MSGKKLSTWAQEHGVHYRTALAWTKAGTFPGRVTKTPGGHFRVFEGVPQTKPGLVAIYGRVSSSDQKPDLERQIGRLRDFAAAQGLIVVAEVSEIGSGLNGRRKKLMKLLSDPEVGTIVVEHRDRLARFGVEYIEAALSAQGRSLVVINSGEQKLDLVQDFIDVVTSMCSQIYGRRAAKNRAERALAAAEAAT